MPALAAAFCPNHDERFARAFGSAAACLSGCKYLNDVCIVTVGHKIYKAEFTFKVIHVEFSAVEVEINITVLIAG